MKRNRRNSTTRLLKLLLLVLSIAKLSNQCVRTLRPDGTWGTGTQGALCPDTYYLDRATCKCEPCHPYCFQCNGPHMRNCSNCKPGGISRVTFSSDQGYFCWGCDRENQYRDIITKVCHDCHPSCKTCYGAGGHKCRACRSGHKMTGGGSCI